MTIAAVFIAILLPAIQWSKYIKRKRLEGLRRAENLLVAVAGDIFTLSDSLDRAKIMVEGMTRHGLLPGPLPFRADTYAISIPPGLHSAITLAAALDAPAVQALSQLMLSVFGYNSRLRKIGDTNLAREEVLEVRAGLLLNVAGIELAMDAVMAYFGNSPYAP